jgi:hypothetical protein
LADVFDQMTIKINENPLTNSFDQPFFIKG